VALNENFDENLQDLAIDIDSLDISDFLDESRFADAEEISKVMAASCTTCECCCSVS
jgi:thiazolylpeptide-type bacteriocin precursor